MALGKGMFIQTTQIPRVLNACMNITGACCGKRVPTSAASGQQLTRSFRYIILLSPSVLTHPPKKNSIQSPS